MSSGAASPAAASTHTSSTASLFPSASTSKPAASTRSAARAASKRSERLLVISSFTFGVAPARPVRRVPAIETAEPPRATVAGLGRNVLISWPHAAGDAPVRVRLRFDSDASETDVVEAAAPPHFPRLPPNCGRVRVRLARALDPAGERWGPEGPEAVFSADVDGPSAAVAADGRSLVLLPPRLRSQAILGSAPRSVRLQACAAGSQAWVTLYSGPWAPELALQSGSAPADVVLLRAFVRLDLRPLGAPATFWDESLAVPAFLQAPRLRVLAAKPDELVVGWPRPRRTFTGCAVRAGLEALPPPPAGACALYRGPDAGARLTPLRPGTVYALRLTLRCASDSSSSLGDCDWAAAPALRAPQPFFAATPPEAPDVSPLPGGRALRVQWEPPRFGCRAEGAPALAVRVVVSGRAVPCNALDRSAVVDGLRPLASYSVSVEFVVGDVVAASPAVEAQTALSVEATPGGLVRVEWTGSGKSWVVARDGVAVARTTRPWWVDEAPPRGREVTYSVDASSATVRMSEAGVLLGSSPSPSSPPPAYSFPINVRALGKLMSSSSSSSSAAARPRPRPRPAPLAAFAEAPAPRSRLATKLLEEVRAGLQFPVGAEGVERALSSASGRPTSRRPMSASASASASRRPMSASASRRPMSAARSRPASARPRGRPMLARPQRLPAA